MAGDIVEVTDSNFQAEVLESETAVLVDFWAPWCGPCGVIAPSLAELNDERDDLRIVKLNVDENQQTADTHDDMPIPALIGVKHGGPATRSIGALPKRRLVHE